MTHSVPFILHSFCVDEACKHRTLDHEEISGFLKSPTLAWVHIDATHPEAQSWLDRELSYLDPYIVESLIAESTRPSMTQIGEGALINLRGVNLNENADPEDMVSIRMWVDAHRIISVQRRSLKAVGDMARTLTEKNTVDDAGDFVCQLIKRLFARLETTIIALDDVTDNIEASLLEEARKNLREQIVDVRIQAIMFRRYLAPQRDAILQLRNSDIIWVTDAHRRTLQEQYNQITRYVEDLDAIRERAQIIKDELANLLSDRLNRNLYVLSVISAIFLPLGFLTGLFGINIGGMPGVDDANAFWVFSGALLLLVAVQAVLFKWFRWF